MQVAIVGGTGAQGRGLAARLARAGVTVLMGSRDAAHAREVVRELEDRQAGAAIEPATNTEAIARADTVLLTVPFTHAAVTLEANRERFQRGSLLIDVTVPVAFDQGVPRLMHVPERSASEHLRHRLPGHVAMAAAFKTLPAHVLAALDEPLDCDEFICGDSPAARTRALELAGRIAGLRPVDAGDLAAAGCIEAMTVLAITLNKRHRVRSARFRVVGL
jgi:8-hydroxy-5-deazaflavin:NADPH oxidoreductase